MEPEANPQTEPQEEKVTMTFSDLRALLREEVKAAVAPLLEQNQALQEQVTKSSAMDYAEGVPAHLRRGDPAVDPNRMSVARSVTIATRPVIENPEQYQNVVDPGTLVRNTYSGGMQGGTPDGTD